VNGHLLLTLLCSTKLRLFPIASMVPIMRRLSDDQTRAFEFLDYLIYWVNPLIFLIFLLVLALHRSIETNDICLFAYPAFIILASMVLRSKYRANVHVAVGKILNLRMKILESTDTRQRVTRSRRTSHDNGRPYGRNELPHPHPSYRERNP
jgi:hypothetical protein